MVIVFLSLGRLLPVRTLFGRPRLYMPVVIVEPLVCDRDVL
jgi:hypothetical protein